MKPEIFIKCLDAKERLNLFKELVEFYDCVTVKSKDENGIISEDTISGENIRLDNKTLNECIVITL